MVETELAPECSWCDVRTKEEQLEQSADQKNETTWDATLRDRVSRIEHDAVRKRDSEQGVQAARVSSAATRTGDLEPPAEGDELTDQSGPQDRVRPEY